MAGVPALIADAAINKTLRSAVDVGGAIWPILGGQSLSETPGSANIETVNFFLVARSYPGEEQPGQFQFNWGLTPGSPIDQVLIDAGRNKTSVKLDFRAPGAVTLDPVDTARFRITVKEADGNAKKGLSELLAGSAIDPGDPTMQLHDPGWLIDDNIRVGSVIELAAAPNDKSEDLICVAAIMYDADGANPKMFVKGRDAEYIGPANFKVFDPNINYVVSGTGISFSTDTTGPAPIGQLTMTMDQEPLFELIRSSDVDRAYQY